MASDQDSSNEFAKNKKSVDQSWKESVQKEKDGPPNSAAGESAPPATDFAIFLSTLGMQALMALGELENPATGEKKVHHEQAKYLVDTLEMLAEKTKGNTTPDEAAMLQNLLYELRLKFVEKNQGAG